MRLITQAGVCGNPLPKPLEWDAFETWFHQHPIKRERLQPAGSSNITNKPTTTSCLCHHTATVPGGCHCCRIKSTASPNGQQSSRTTGPSHCTRPHSVCKSQHQLPRTQLCRHTASAVLRHVHWYRHFCACLLLLDTHTVMQATWLHQWLLRQCGGAATGSRSSPMRVCRVGGWVAAGGKTAAHTCVCTR